MLVKPTTAEKQTMSAKQKTKSTITRTRTWINPAIAAMLTERIQMNNNKKAMLAKPTIAAKIAELSPAAAVVSGDCSETAAAKQTIGGESTVSSNSEVLTGECSKTKAAVAIEGEDNGRSVLKASYALKEDIKI